jgi:hypothetical protein
MKKAIVVAGAFLLLGGLSGCRGSSDPEADLQEHINIWNETADVLNTIKDQESLEKARGKLKELGQRDTEINRRLAAAKKDLSEEAKQRFEQKYAKQLQEAVVRLNAAWLQASKVPGAKDLPQIAQAPR